MILPVKTQCRRHRRVMEVILLKQKQIKCPYCHAHASLRPASLVYADVTRLMQFKVKKGSMIWLAGSQRLVDVRMKDGKLEKKLKVSLNDFGFLPKQPAAANRQENDPDITAEPAPPPTEVLDGDRESLPE